MTNIKLILVIKDHIKIPSRHDKLFDNLPCTRSKFLQDMTNCLITYLAPDLNSFKT
jgi:hypothetical protein